MPTDIMPVYYIDKKEMPRSTIANIKKDLREGFSIRYLTIKYRTVRRVILDIKGSM